MIPTAIKLSLLLLRITFAGHLCATSDSGGVAAFGSIDEVQTFLDERLGKNQSGDVSIGDEFNTTQLMCAIAFQTDPEVVTLLLRRGADVNATESHARTPLMYLFYFQKDPELVSSMALQLPERKADVNARDSLGWTPLMLFFKYQKDPELVSSLALQLLERKADVNAPDSLGYTPLLVLFRYQKDPELVSSLALQLLERKADVNARANDGYTPLMYLLQYQSPPPPLSPLFLFYFQKDPELVSSLALQLLERKADVNAMLSERKLSELVTHPALCLASRSRSTLALRMVATLAFVVLVKVLRQECKDDWAFASGHMSLETRDNTLSEFTTVHGVVFMNYNGFGLACPAAAGLPNSVAPFFALYLKGTWCVAAVWLFLAVARICGFGATAFDDSKPSPMDLVQELERVSDANRIHEGAYKLVRQIPDAKFLRAFKTFPPGGLNVDLVLSIADLIVLDGLTIWNCVLTGHVKFAGVLAFIFTASLLGERNVLGALNKERLASSEKGYLTPALCQWFEAETGFEAPLSLIVTVYSFPFFLRSRFSFFTGLLSMLLSIKGLAEFNAMERLLSSS